MKPAITEGIIAVANHKLRLEGIDSYKEYLSKEWYSKEKLKEVFNKHKFCYLCCENRYSDNSTGNCVDNIIEELGLEE